MIFNSFEFAFFFPVVFLLYWLVFNKTINSRNLFVVAVSYFFYGFWDWRFLSLIITSSLVDYIIGLKIHNSSTPKTRKWLLFMSVAVNIGMLGFFKYCNFFVDSFIDLFSLFGTKFSASTLEIILPVGISFYTFQTMSYTIDIYHKKLEPTKNVFAFFAFVSFFPQLVAGPIERAKHLLPQFYELHKPNYQLIRSGVLMVALGLFKKIVIADRLAIFINESFSEATGIALATSILFFAFQLYLDFSAYSEIAIGTARMIGFNLSTNFKRPYLAKSFSDFWTRWHISLSSWFRDYVYIPLGGSKVSSANTIRNILIVFIISGLWHGASWNFAVWGLLNGLFLILFDKFLVKNSSFKIGNTLFVFVFWALSLVFFRAADFHEALRVFTNIGFNDSDLLYNYGLNEVEFKLTAGLLVTTIIFEMLNERHISFANIIFKQNPIVRYTVYISIAFAIVFLGSYGIGVSDNTFIYFQF